MPVFKTKKQYMEYYLQCLINKKLTLREVSQSTGYSITWLSILKHKYIKDGPACLIHGNTGRTPVNKTSAKLRNKLINIYKAEYQDVNFNYYRICLKQYENITVSYSTLRRLLLSAQIKSPEQHKTKKVKTVHRMRPRRIAEGDLVQIDGTPYPWFYKFGDTTNYDLQGAIDDATGKLTGLYFTKNECLYGHLEVLRQTCITYGVPREIYSDRAAIFCVTPRKKPDMNRLELLAELKKEKTQWQRVLSEMSIHQILAWTPEAKGRVERMWRTIQGQLPAFLFRHGAKNMEEANKILHKYMQQFNNNYSVNPISNKKYWMPVPLNLDHILQCRIKRKTNHAGVFSFHAYKFQLDYKYCSYRDMELCISERGISAYIDNQYMPVHIIDDYISAGDMPHVLEDLIYKYLYAPAKEVSA